MARTSLKPRTSLKLWVGIGSFVVTGAAGGALGDTLPAAVPLQVAQQHQHPAPAKAADDEAAPAAKKAEGGEGGESGAFNAAPKEVQAAGLRMLALGHLTAGRALFERGDTATASDHVRHPVAEVFGDFPDNPVKDVAPKFNKALDTLGEEVAKKGADKAKIRASFDTIARDLMEGVHPTDPKELVGVAIILLKQAAAEYANAVVDGKFVNIPEYQDAFGFVRVTEQLLQAGNATLAAKNKDRLARAQEILAQIAKGFPTVLPPEKPILTPGELNGATARFELTAQALAK